MSNPISSVAKIPDVAPSAIAPSPTPSSAAASAPSAAATAPSAAQSAISAAENARLVIEDDKAAGCFVYKVIDRTTGEVLQQTPSEQIVKLRESDGYLAGDVFKAQV
jgi:hypothetical protein